MIDTYCFLCDKRVQLNYYSWGTTYSFTCLNCSTYNGFFIGNFINRIAINTDKYGILIDGDSTGKIHTVKIACKKIYGYKRINFLPDFKNGNIDEICDRIFKLVVFE